MIWTFANEYASIKNELMETIETGLKYKFRFPLKYPKFKAVNIMGEHPFATLDFALKKGDTPPDLFPAIAISVQSSYGDSPTLGFDWAQGDFTREMLEDYRSRKNQLADKSVFSEIETSLNSNQQLYIYSIKQRYNQVVTLDIWADNKDVKDALYDTTYALLMSAMEYLVGLGLNNITLEGKKDGFYNDDYVSKLLGSQIYLTLNNTMEIFDVVDGNEPDRDYLDRQHALYYTSIKSVDMDNEYETV